MKALIYILAILLIAAGIAVGLMSFFSPGEVILGFNLGLAATLLTGGVVTLALAGVMTAVAGLRRQLKKQVVDGPGIAGRPARRTAEAPAAAVAVGAGAAAGVAAARVDETSAPATVAREVLPEAEADEIRRAEETPVEEVAEAAGEGAEESAEAEEEVAEVQVEAEAGTEAEAEAEIAAVEEAAEAIEETGEEIAETEEGEELYVVEERVFRGRAARMLSDGTVEAETDEGWMRFENLEHLEEYMDAMGHAR